MFRFRLGLFILNILYFFLASKHVATATQKLCTTCHLIYQGKQFSFFSQSHFQKNSNQTRGKFHKVQTPKFEHQNAKIFMAFSLLNFSSLRWTFSLSFLFVFNQWSIAVTFKDFYFLRHR